MPHTHLNLLVVDDCQDDADLVVRHFVKAGYEVEYRRVDTRADMEAALKSRTWDAVISDVAMPQFSVMAAYELYREHGVDCPFLAISGVIPEESAIHLLKSGAHDFVLKSRLARLVPAFERERREVAERRARREAEEARRLTEERYALAARGSNDGLWDWDILSGAVYYSSRWRTMLGLPEPADGEGGDGSLGEWLNRIHPDDLERVQQALDDHLAGRTAHFADEHRICHADGGYRWMLARGVAVNNARGRRCRMAGSLTDISAHKLSEMKLRQAVAAKTRFLAAASHDMRQPIQALFCFASVLASRLGDGDPDLRSTLSDLENSLVSLKDLLDALLDVSKLDAGLVTAAPGPVPLAAVMERVRAEMAPLAEGKGLKLRVAPTSAVAHSDPVLLARILRNLTENAIRYTDRGGILLGCRPHGDRLCVQVCDSGIGISEADREQIFEEFFQLGNPERDRRKGLGLGLAIVSRLARLLGHRIEVASRPGRGSCFKVSLERQAEAAGPEAPPAAIRGPATAGGDGWVLVVDDETTVARAFAGVIRGWGYAVVTAASVEEALDRAQRGGAPSVIITDYRLQAGRTGVEVIESVRTLFGRDIPSIVVTGDTAAERLAEIASVNAAVLHKPVPPAELRQALAQVAE